MAFAPELFDPVGRVTDLWPQTEVLEKPVGGRPRAETMFGMSVQRSLVPEERSGELNRMHVNQLESVSPERRRHLQGGRADRWDVRRLNKEPSGEIEQTEILRVRLRTPDNRKSMVPPYSRWKADRARAEGRAHSAHVHEANRRATPTDAEIASGTKVEGRI